MKVWKEHFGGSYNLYAAGGVYDFKNDGTVTFISDIDHYGIYELNGNELVVYLIEEENGYGNRIKSEEEWKAKFIVQDEDTLLQVMEDGGENVEHYRYVEPSMETICGKYRCRESMHGDSFTFDEQGNVRFEGIGTAIGKFSFVNNKIIIDYTEEQGPEDTEFHSCDSHETLTFANENIIFDEYGNKYIKLLPMSIEDVVGSWEFKGTIYGTSYSDLGFGSIGPGTFIIKSDGTYFDGINPSSYNSDSYNDVNGTYSLYDDTLTLNPNSGKDAYPLIVYNNELLYYYVLPSGGWDYLVLKKSE